MKKIIKTYKFKLSHLRKSQERIINSWIGTCRVVYNLAKEAKEESYRKGVSLSNYDLHKQLPALRQEFEWIKDVDSQTLQDACDRLDKAFKSFYKGGGYPKWAKRDQYNSFTLKRITDHKDGFIKLPKIGWLRYFNSRQFPKSAKLKRATITKELDGYYIVVMFEVNAVKPINILSDSQCVGIDAGITDAFSLSNGTFIKNERFYQNNKEKLHEAQHKLSRMQKGSKRFKRQKLVVSKFHRKVARSRNDWQHKMTYDLIHSFDFFAIENVKLKNMTKAVAKGETGVKNGRKAKSGLNRELLDVAISSFYEKLEYKAAWNGKTVYKVNPKNSSRECNKCGHTQKESRDKKYFHCVACGHSDDADTNAAKNLLDRALSKLVKTCEHTALGY